MSLVNGARRRRWLLGASVTVEAVASAALVAAAVANPQPWLVFATVLWNLVAVGLITAIVGSWATARSERRLERRIERRIDRVEATVESTRAKASRHEWIQEQSLERIERTTRDVSATAAGLAWFRPRAEPDAAPPSVPRVLFVTSNGGGMGHIARCSAVIRHAESRLTGRVLTLSTAAPLVAAAGYDVEYFPSQTATGLGSARWCRQFTRKLLQVVSEFRPATIVFDGTWVYPSLTDAAEYANTPLVWLRRGLWREGADLSQVKAWREHVTSVVTPRDVAQTDVDAPDIFRDAVWTDAVSLAPKTLMSRESALASLGLDTEHQYALVQLSGGNGTGSATASAVQAIRKSSEILPVVVKSPLLSESVVHAAATIDGRFPLVDVARAWEFTVTGAGYNSVHENLHTQTPGVYLPSTATITDDQERRAAAIANQGLGVVAKNARELHHQIVKILRNRELVEVARKIESHHECNGAASVASAIIQAGNTANASAFTIGGASNR